MFSTLRLGRAFGIDLYLHWSFWLLPAWFFLSHLGDGMSVAVSWVVFILTVFGCVLLHELGHALMAAHFRIGTRDITLYPIGGVARLEGTGTRPSEELFIALAGPAVNVAIAAVLGLGLAVLGMPLLASPTDELWQAFPQALMATNIGLVIFNMLPAFPMDGGRVLRAVLEMVVGRLEATRLAAWVGAVLAGLFGLGGIVTGNLSLCLLGLMVFFLGQSELAMVRLQARQDARPARLQSLPVTDFMANPDLRPPEPGYNGFTWDAHRRIWVEWRDGRAVGGVVVG